jgi:hypothetical protein
MSAISWIHCIRMAIGASGRFSPSATAGAGVAAGWNDGRRDGLRLGEQPVQHGALDPVVSADPARQALLAFPLEPDHERDVRPVDRGRDDLEHPDLRHGPHAVLGVAVGDRRLLPADSSGGHDRFGSARVKPERLRLRLDKAVRCNLGKMPGSVPWATYRRNFPRGRRRYHLTRPTTGVCPVPLILPPALAQELRPTVAEARRRLAHLARTR